MPLASHLKVSRHGVYYFRVVIPVALRSAFGGRCEIKKSLSTRCPRTAKRFAYNLSSYVLALFDEVRQMAGYNPNRFNPEDPSTWPTDSKGKYEIDLQRGIFKADPSIPGDHEGMMSALDKIGMIPTLRPEPIKSVVESAVVNALATHPAASTPPPASVVRKPLKISKAIPLYIGNLDKRTNNDKTPLTYESNCYKFMALVGDKFIHEVTEMDVERYKDWCLEDDPTLKPQSRDGRLFAISGLMAYAKKNGHFSRDMMLPTEGMFLLTKKEREALAVSAEPFLVEELQKIFEPVAYQKYVSKYPARFWLPLLALFTGARIEELAQLHRSDISSPQGVRILHINDFDNKKVKSKAGKRFVPIHPILIDLGFADYLSDLARLYPKEKMLFPYLSKTKNGYSASVGKAFNGYLKKLGVKPEGEKQRTKVFHSFRHTMNNEMASRGVTLELRCGLVGHELNNVNSRIYTQDSVHSVLMECIMKLAYERDDGMGNVVKLDLAPLAYQKGQFDEDFPKLMKDKAINAHQRKAETRAKTLAKKQTKKSTKNRHNLLTLI